MTEPDDDAGTGPREPRRSVLDPALAAAVAAALAADPTDPEDPEPADDSGPAAVEPEPAEQPEAEPETGPEAVAAPETEPEPAERPGAARPETVAASEETGAAVVDLDALTAVDEPEPEPVDTGESAEEELPQLAGPRLAAALEALLLVVDSPVPDDALASALDVPVLRVREALVQLAAQYTEQQRGIDLRPVGDGWRLFTRDVYAPYVEKLLLDGQRAKLTRAALETLAVIAYRQPVTRARVAAVRGVNVDGVIRTLLARGLIEETGTDGETGGILYRTTELFLERLGLSSLEDLPPIAPLLPEVDAIDDV